ncbi:glycosyltransferase family 2 protein [Alteromonas mediterranea]|uniref:glycosyltransferase family 2 protein n=1 Tax=Alteromonas mediterranea TaxID=314275 RepID=UPI001131396E|nr:glycosyltransferase family A protein [Alteromonas mediterranea]QDG34544.1 glycosyltransferase family 2 protein [Alteromonas mediterranea]
MDISVVITTCNRPAFLKEALIGISKQTLKPKEVIVVNDCSEISYESALDAIKKVNGKHILLKERSGANRARNIGIQNCSSGIIAFLDDDDIWLPNYLSEIYRQYQEGADAVVTGFRQLGNESIVVVNQDSQVTKSSLLRGNTYCGMSGFSCKKEIIEALLFDEQLPNGQDWDMFARLLLGNYDFRNISKGLFLYRFQNADGIGAKLRTLKPKDIVHRLASANKHREFLGDYWYKKRVCDQILFSLKHKKNRLSWIVLAVRLTGIKATANFFFNMVKRKLLNKPMSI